MLLPIVEMFLEILEQLHISRTIKRGYHHLRIVGKIAKVLDIGMQNFIDNIGRFLKKPVCRVVLVLLVLYVSMSGLVVLNVKGVQYYKSHDQSSYDQKFGLCHAWYRCPLNFPHTDQAKPLSPWAFGDGMPEGRDFENFANYESGIFCPFCLWNFFWRPKPSSLV